MERTTDENTGREVRVLSLPGEEGLSTPYYRTHNHLPDGRTLVNSKDGMLAIDVETGERELVAGGLPILGPLEGGAVAAWDGRSRTVFRVDPVAGTMEALGSVSDEGFSPTAILATCDGKALVWSERVSDTDHPAPYSNDAEALWAWYERPRRGHLWCERFADGCRTRLHHAPTAWVILPGTSPTDPDLVLFSCDWNEHYNQRIWMVRASGGAAWPVRPQEAGELVVHEFWWPDGRHVGYKYLDRRKDDSIRRYPWAEYAPVPTQFGLADAATGEEVYSSDPLNCYHTHIRSDTTGTLLCGEGTEDVPFVCAARFSTESTKVDMVPLGTIHTPYIPFGGHGANANFTPDGRWLVYSDSHGEERRILAVRVDLD